MFIYIKLHFILVKRRFILFPFLFLSYYVILWVREHFFVFLNLGGDIWITLMLFAMANHFLPKIWTIFMHIRMNLEWIKTSHFIPGRTYWIVLTSQTLLYYYFQYKIWMHKWTVNIRYGYCKRIIKTDPQFFYFYRSPHFALSAF